MKFLAIILLIALTACGNQNETRKTASTDSLINTGKSFSDSSNAEGARLLTSNDCLSCHKLNEKNVGPSYMQISQKYALTQSNIENLSYKIIKGGVGAWGNTVMPAHPTVTPQQASQMAKYILSLNNNKDTSVNKKDTFISK
ncbi:MAG: c-type cytochrome [Chitinophagaceae bacterium]